jgi:hypothetical protein
MKNKHLRWALTLAFALVAGIALLRAFARTHKDPPGQDEETARTPSRVTVRNGETVIRLTAGDRSRAGIETETLKPARERREITAPAVVLDVESLVNLAAGYATAQANLRQAENNLSVSEVEFERLKGLYSDQQNVSAKSFQAAEGTFKNDRDAAAMARKNLEFQMAALRQSWGDEIARWAASGAAPLERILNRQDVLVQVTMRAEESAAAPAAISLELPNQRRAAAKLISRFPRVDPRIQGASFLYVARSESLLAPGLNLVAHVPEGQRVAGVVLPISAVVWLDGKPWVYVETAANQFARRGVSTSQPAGEGFFVSEGFAPGERIVRAGAQSLLSEEFRAPGGGGEGDTD